MAEDLKDPPISAEVIYRIAYDTRNLEISLFWQRSNYFLVLNTAIAAGFVTLKEARYRLLLCGFGFIVSMLWTRIAAGSKFWQSRWERRLARLEEDLDLPQRLFSERRTEIRQDVAFIIDSSNHHGVAQSYDWLIKRKPSVSLTMAILSVVFGGFWIVAAVLTLLP